MAIAAIENGAEIFDVNNDTTIKFQSRNNIDNRSIAWNFNGELVAIANYEGVLTIWTKGKQLINTIKKNDMKNYVAIDRHLYKNEIIVPGYDVRIFNDNGNPTSQWECIDAMC